MLRCGALCSAYMRSFKRFGYSLADILIMCTGWCFVCNISLSPETANEHFESRTHLNRCLQKGIGISVVPSSGIESISHFKCCIFIHESFILVLRPKNSFQCEIGICWFILSSVGVFKQISTILLHCLCLFYFIVCFTQVLHSVLAQNFIVLFICFKNDILIFNY